MKKYRIITTILTIISVTLLLINQSFMQQLEETKSILFEQKELNNRIVQYMVELENENQILGSCCANDGNLSE
tara:strand:+ start:711 stop:929 length:219 start_codon:yes stop_codon:yes gene_type:complete